MAPAIDFIPGDDLDWIVPSLFFNRPPTVSPEMRTGEQSRPDGLRSGDI